MFERFISTESHNDSEVFQHNLEMLRTAMFEMVASESIGGNASQVKIEGRVYPCVAANAYADPRTGELIAFGNVGHAEPRDAERLAHFSLRMAVDAHRSWRLFAVTLMQDARATHPALTDPARSAIQAALDSYNADNAISEAA